MVETIYKNEGIEVDKMKLMKKNIIQLIHNPYKFFINCNNLEFNDEEFSENGKLEQNSNKEGSDDIDKDIDTVKVNGLKDVEFDRLTDEEKYELAKKNQKLVENTKQVNETLDKICYHINSMETSFKDKVDNIRYDIDFITNFKEYAGIEELDR